MKYLILILIVASCSHKERPLQERQLIQCYMESDTYTVKKPFTANMSIDVSELGTVLKAKVLNSTVKDPNLNACLSYVIMGAGKPFQIDGQTGPVVKELTFRPDGKHEL
jgi:hypothetical protein